MPAQDGYVTAHAAKRRQRMLQQRASVECDCGFVLPHTRALAARKNKARKLGVDHCGYCTPLKEPHPTHLARYCRCRMKRAVIWMPLSGNKKRTRSSPRGFPGFVSCVKEVLALLHRDRPGRFV